jgi:tetratricopeptide (TPR) repeat protein
MLTDLRERLKGVGRIDVMTAVNERALDYYKGQDLTSLPVDSLERRARILHAMGEDDENRGDHTHALFKFREAERTTAALLKVAPNDPERIFDQAQSAFWLGEVAFQEKKLSDARKQFLAYRNLATRMIKLDPTSIKYKLELDYAESNLCTMAIGKPVDPSEALIHCGAALAQIKTIALEFGKSGRNGESGLTRQYIDDLIRNCHANMADAYLRNNNVSAARKEREAEEELLKNEMAADPKNKDLDYEWIILQRALAQFEVSEGIPEAAHARLERALDLATQIIQYDPGNKMWARTRNRVMDDLDKLQHQ